MIIYGKHRVVYAGILDPHDRKQLEQNFAKAFTPRYSTFCTEILQPSYRNGADQKQLEYKGLSEKEFTTIYNSIWVHYSPILKHHETVRLFSVSELREGAVSSQHFGESPKLHCGLLFSQTDTHQMQLWQW